MKLPAESARLMISIGFIAVTTKPTPTANEIIQKIIFIVNVDGLAKIL